MLRLDFLPESTDQDASALLERTRLFYLSISAPCPSDLQVLIYEVDIANMFVCHSESLAYVFHVLT